MNASPKLLESLEDLDSLSFLPHPEASNDLLAAQFTDLARPLTLRQAAIESARCLYCYDAPCTRICPTGIDVASFIRNIHEHNINGAAFGILQQNILGGSCARVCPTEILCEDACVRNHDEEGQPVKIGLLQRHAIDHMQFDGHPFSPLPATGKTIAIVGAGPAGLSCAHRLAMLGNKVVVFEARAKPGGLNEYGIAKYKLTDDYAQKEIDFLLGIKGIELRHGQRLGSNLDLKDLHAQYDAVFLALGLGASRELGLTGEDAPGLLDAVTYIAALRQSDDLSLLPLPRRAIVIGAGNTAVDMAVQIARLGAKEVTLVYRRGVDAMTATTHEQDIAKANGVRIVTWARPQQVLLNANGQVTGMRFASTSINEGQLVDTGESVEIGADAIFKAIGQQFNLGAVDGDSSALLQGGAKIVVDAQFRTSMPGIYAGGDCIAPGQDLTVQAVQHGKLAAIAIHADLNSNLETHHHG
jgi:dihydropyrimidine dehydrogenase (NAD+) subunit PreT